MPAPGSPAGPGTSTDPGGSAGGAVPAQPQPTGGATQRGAPGTVIGGRYALRTAIGHGGMGTVWRASDTVLRRDVAVKEVLLPPGLAAADRDAMYQRTLREARAAAALSHPAVVQVYDVVTDAGRPWIVMELLQSRSLAEMIVEDGPVAPRAVAKIGMALLGALEVAHAAGVLHRDVKPANVLISSDGRCVLTDFGVARMPTDAELTTPGMVLGSPHFISPERAIGAAFGPPSDLFSLGVTLYTAVEGRPPFDKSDPFETMRAVVEEQPQPAMRAGALSGVLYGLLEKDPGRRWNVESARSVLRELLAGPLASNAPSTQFTDPYAVVRPAPFTPPPATPPSGQIGGRAMLAPGESVTDAVRRRDETAYQPTAPTVGGPADLTSGGSAAPPPPPPGRSTPAPRRPSSRNDSTGALDLREISGLNTPVGTDPGLRPVGPIPAQPGPTGDHRAGRHAAPEPPPQSRAAAALASVGRIVEGNPRLRQCWAALRRTSPVTRAAAAAVALLVLLVAVLGLGQVFGAGDVGRQRAMAAPSPTGPAFPVQEHRDQRGFAVNVPKEWSRRTSNSSFIDYVDPADQNRRLRLNIERTSTSPKGFAEIAENFLRKSDSCDQPYQRVGLREDVTLAGLPAAELEYTCGSGADTRHGIWRVTVSDGRAFHFFLTVPDSGFRTSRAIYDEMVRSYRFGS